MSARRAREMRAYLDEVSEQLGVQPTRTWATWQRVVLGGSAVGLLFGAQGCGGSVDDCSGEECEAELGGVSSGGATTGGSIATGGISTGGTSGNTGSGGFGALYGVPMEADCNNDRDDDHDGGIDCEDQDCWNSSFCAQPAYGMPMEEYDCSDRADNDGDGKVDCLDSDCVGHLACMPAVGGLYGIPYTGGMPSAGGAPSTGGVPAGGMPSGGVGGRYAMPMPEDCSPGTGDEDLDGLANCADPDCIGGSWCNTDYGIPLPVETACYDKLDNDSDGKTDCDDLDCVRQCTALYMAPMW